MNEIKHKSDRKWSLGIMLLGIATLLLVYPYTDEVTIQCDHDENMCEVRKVSIFEENIESFSENYNELIDIAKEE